MSSVSHPCVPPKWSLIRVTSMPSKHRTRERERERERETRSLSLSLAPPKVTRVLWMGLEAKKLVDATKKELK